MSAKIEIKHLDATDKDSFIKCDSIHVNDLDEHFLEITLKELSTTNTIWLDVSTAIRFAKTLRTEINKIKS